MLAGAVHEQLGVPSSAAGRLRLSSAKSVSSSRSRDLLAERDRARRGELVARREVAGEPLRSPLGSPSKPRSSRRGPRYRGRRARGTSPAGARVGRSRSTASRGGRLDDLVLVAGRLEPHERCAGLDLAADQTRSSRTRPAKGAGRTVSIFIDSRTRTGAPGGDLVAYGGRGRDDERGRGRAHDATLVAGDAVGDAVHLVEVDGVTHRVSRDEGGVVRSPAPALVVATPCRSAPRSRRAPRARPRVDEDGDGAAAPFPARVRELLVAVGSQVETGPLWSGSTTVTRRRSRRRPPRRRRPRPARLERRPGDGRERVDRGMGPLGEHRLRRRPERDRGCSPATSRRATSSPRRSRSLEEEIAVLELVADFAELSRNRPPARSGTPSCSCTARASTSTPTSRASTSSAPGCRRSSATSSPACCATTASTEFERTPTWRRRSSASSSPSSARRPRCSSATSILQRWLAEPIPAAAARRRRPRRARPARRRDPAALPRHRRPRPQRPLPLVRPAARRRGARRASSLASATSSPRSPPSPTRPDHAARIDELAAIPEQIVRFLAERLHEEPGGRRARADARGAHQAALPRARAARPAHLLRGRPALRRRRLHARRPSDPPDVDDRRGRRARARQRARRGRVERRWSRPDRATRPSSTSTCAGRTSRSRPRTRASSWPRCCRQLPFAQRRTPRRRRRLCRPRRPVGYFTFRPAERRAGRGPARARRAPHGRAARSTCGGCAPST